MIKQFFMSRETQFIAAVVHGMGMNYDNSSYDFMRWRDIIFTTIKYLIAGLVINPTGHFLYYSILIYIVHMIYLRYYEDECSYKNNKRTMQEIIAYCPHYLKLNSVQEIIEYTKKLDYQTQANIFSIITKKIDE